MKNYFLLLGIWLVLLLSSQSVAQTNPTLHNLSISDYTFTEWSAATPAGTYPANMRFWRTGTQDPTLAATANADWTGAYNLTSGPRVNGLGDNGFSFINTGTNGNLGMAVVGLNATGRENIQVSWTGGTIEQNARIYRIRLQYRVGSGSWTDVPGPVEYEVSTNGHSQTFGPTTLPSEVNNEAEVYVRWFYYYVSGGGTRPQLRVDDITISSDAEGGAPVAAVGTSSNFTPFIYALNDGPSPVQSFSVNGQNLENSVTISVPSNFEHALAQDGPFQTTDLTLTPTSGTLSATSVYVRLAAGLTGGSYSGSLTIASDDPSSPASVAITGQVLFETLPYFENFGTTAGVFPLGWTTSGPGAANWTVGTSTASTQDGAGGSGGANLQNAGSIVGQEAIITVNRAISTVGADDVLVSFLARQTSAYSGNLLLDFSTNGTDWTNVPFADVANNGAWAPVVVSLPAEAAGVENLRIRFRTTRTNSSGNYRIDDFRILAPSRFVYQSGDLHDVTSWQDADEANPVDFTSDNQLFVITGTSSATTTADWTVSGSNSRIIVGDGTSATTLTITENFSITGTVQVRDNATLNLLNTTLPTLSGLEDNSTVVYGMDGAATIQSVAYGNLTVTGSGTKTFPNSTVAINGNLLFEDVTLAFAGTSARIDYSGDITLAGTINYSGGLRPEYRITANSRVQTITTGAATLEAFNFYAQNKTGGSLNLATGNADVRALNNLRLNFPAGVGFNDGGNTIIFGDDLRVQGDAASYTLTGTLRLEANSGTNDFENIEVPLNNLEIAVTGTADPQFADGSNTKSISLNGNFSVELVDRDFVMNDVTLNIGGNISVSASGEGRIAGSEAILIFSGNGAQSVSGNVPTRISAVTVDKSSGNVTLESALEVTGPVTLTSGTLASDGNLVLVSESAATGGYIAGSGAGTVTGDVTVQRWITSTSPSGSGQFFGLGLPFDAPYSGSNGLFSSVWTQGAIQGGSTTAGSPNLFFFDAVNNMWEGIVNLDATMPKGQGVAAAIFTDDVFGTPGSWPKVLSAAGSLSTAENNGSEVSLPLGSDQNRFNFVANPFAAPVSWTSEEWSKTGIHDGYWVLNSSGSFDAFDGDLGTGIAQGIIAMNQAFLLYSTADNPSVSVNSGAKTTDAVVFMKDNRHFIRLALSTEEESLNEILFSFRNTDTEGMAFIHPLRSDYSAMFTTSSSSAPMTIRYLSDEVNQVIQLPIYIASVNGMSGYLDVSGINLPEGWSASIRNEQTGTRYDLADLHQIRVDAAPSTVAQPDHAFSLIVAPGSTTDLDTGDFLPTAIALEQNFPNPFNPVTAISYSLPSETQVRLDVITLQGQRVATLVQGTQSAGTHRVNFDASHLSSGIYLYRLEAGGQVITRKMTLIK